MLSRVAESLYWTARYVERAEDVTRILDVNFHTLLDMQVEDRGQAWRQIVQLLGDEDAYARALRLGDGIRRERLGALARRQPECRRQLHHPRA